MMNDDCHDCQWRRTEHGKSEQAHREHVGSSKTRDFVSGWMTIKISSIEELFDNIDEVLQSDSTSTARKKRLDELKDTIKVSASFHRTLFQLLYHQSGVVILSKGLENVLNH